MTTAAIYVVVLSSFCCSTTCAHWRRFSEGDVLIGALFPVTSGSDCKIVQTRGLILVEAFVFAVNRINAANRSVAVLGYDIRDTCSNPEVALKEVLDILGIEQERTTRNCSSTALNCAVVAVIGPDSSHSTAVTSVVLSAYGVPQISYGARSHLLSNKFLYRTLLRTCPTDTQLIASVAGVIAHFGWSCVNIVASELESDSMVMELLRRMLKNHNICVVLQKTGYQKNLSRIVLEIKNRHKVSVTALLGEKKFALKILREARKQNLSKNVWIVARNWNDQFQLVEKNNDISGGVLWLSVTEKDLGEFKTHVNRLRRNLANSYCAWLSQNKQWLNSCNRDVTGNLDSLDGNSLFSTEVAYVIDAVLAVAHGLTQVNDCVINQTSTTNCKMGNLTLLQARDFLLNKLLKKSFSNSQNNTVTFSSTGDVNAEFSILNFHKVNNTYLKPLSVGKWTQERGLFLNENEIRWPGNEFHTPYSGCSDRCRLGMLTKYGMVPCWWKCQKCPSGTYNNNRTATHCKTCPKDLMPDEHQSGCIKKQLAILDPYDWLAILFLATCGLGEVLTLFVLGVFVRYQTTPVVKATNLTFTVITLVILLAWFLIPVLYIGKPTDLTCKLQTVSFCVLYTTVTSVLLAKTNRLIRIFSAFKKTCFLSNCWYGLLTCTLILVQFIMAVVYLIFFPPKVGLDFSHVNVVIVECNEHVILDLATLAYNILLSIICGVLAFKSRKLPRAYNEGNWICLATLTNFLSWVTILMGRHVSAVNNVNTILTVASLIAGAYLMLALLFLPKVRVIFFRPEKNTKLAAIVSTRRYSLEQASGIDLSPVQGSRLSQGLSARRNTSPACLALQLMNGSNAKSTASKCSFGLRRSHVSLIETIKESPEERKDENN